MQRAGPEVLNPVYLSAVKFNEVMLRISKVLGVLLAIIIGGCAPSSAPVQSGPVEVIRVDVAGDSEQTIALLSVTGMTCAHGCGGKIQQELQALKGVITTDLDYSDGRDKNVVSVSYDPSTVTETEFIRCVNAIADGKYQVASVEVRSIHATSGTPGSVSEENGGFLPDFSLFFRLLDVLNSLSHLVA
jgi:copper chaperone CopZ